MERNTFLKELKEFSKDNLNPTTTKISYLNGKQFVRKSKETEEKELEILEENPISNVAYWSKETGFVVDLFPDNSIDEIIPRLYLSGDDAATTKKILEEKNITHIINLTKNVENKYEPLIKYKKIAIYDLPSVNIIDHFQSSYEFIESALNESEKNCVLVHCNAGVSRSSTIVISYLMQKKIFPFYHDAYDFVKSKRPKICPNHGFIKQLINLQIKINK
jgi:atypical dual specificity phosphatase